jgi:two-component system NtrC family sensor kinase
MRDVGTLMVPWRERLSTRLLAAALVAGLVVTAALFVGERAVDRALDARAVAESERLAEVLARATRRAMLEDRRADAYRALDDVASQPGVRRLRLLDGDGRVTHSTARDEVGASVARGDATCTGCHTAAGRPADARPAGRVIDAAGERVASVVVPVRFESSCATGCHAHDGGRRVLGLLEVDLSLAAADAAVAAFRARSAVAAALVVLALGLAGAWFARRHLVAPVAALVAATRRVGSGWSEADLPPTLDGELGVLGEALEATARQQGASREALARLAAQAEAEAARHGEAADAARSDLVRAERLATLGRLSRAVAHRVMDPLSGVRMVARLAGRTLEKGPPDEATRRALRRNLALAERECDRLDEAVRSLLDAVHDRPPISEPLELAAVVGEALDLAGPELALDGVAVERRLAPVPSVRGDAGQLRQAIAHALVELAESMGGGGALRVVLDAAPSGGAALHVEGRGEGTTPGTPAFRVVREVMARHGGTVEARADEHGTAVTLGFPGPPPAEGAGHGAARRG